MDRQTANRILAAILETVASEESGAPSGVMFAALQASGVSLDDYRELLSIAKAVGLVTEENHVVSITSKGRETVAKIVAHRAA